MRAEKVNFVHMGLCLRAISRAPSPTIARFDNCTYSQVHFPADNEMKDNDVPEVVVSTLLHQANVSLVLLLGQY